MTIEMAEIMMRVNSMRPRAKRLLSAILPHAIALETLELEEEILALNEIIDADLEREPRWKTFLHKLSLSSKKKKGETISHPETNPEGNEKELKEEKKERKDLKKELKEEKKEGKDLKKELKEEKKERKDLKKELKEEKKD